MSNVYKQAFVAAVAVAAFATSPLAQEAKKDPADKPQMTFGQHTVDDHGKHLSEARAMAKAKGVQLPSAPAKKHQDAMKTLESAFRRGI